MRSEHSSAGESHASPQSESLYGEELAPGALVGRYVVLQLCFRGAIASMYRAREESTGRIAALKLMHSRFAQTSKFLKRFEREAEALRRLNHPNIVEIWDAGELRDGRPYFAMEWLDGQDLAEELRRHGPHSFQEALSIVKKVGSALSAAHEIGILHRDLKAQNVMVVRKGETTEYKLVDFGIAKFLEPSPSPSGGLTSTGTILGTPVAMAPEQIRGELVDVRTDVYALGVLLYQLLTGQLPFQAANVIELEEMHLYVAPPRPSQRTGVSPAIDDTVVRCLQKKPEDRFQTVAAVLSFIEQSLSLRPSLAIGLFCQIDSNGWEDESWLSRLEDALNAGKQACRRAGLKVLLSTGNGFLASASLPVDPRDEHDFRRQALCAAIDLHVVLSNLGRLRPAISVHVATGEMEIQPDGDPTLTGGELLTLAQWISQEPGVIVTPSAIAGLQDRFHIAPAQRANYFRLIASAEVKSEPK